MLSGDGQFFNTNNILPVQAVIRADKLVTEVGKPEVLPPYAEVGKKRPTENSGNLKTAVPGADILLFRISIKNALQPPVIFAFEQVASTALILLTR